MAMFSPSGILRYISKHRKDLVVLQKGKGCRASYFLVKIPEALRSVDVL